MKPTIFRILAVCAFTVLLIIACSVLGITDGIMLLVLPFTLLGKGLRALSLSGSIGNIAAFILYGLISLLPLLLKLKSKWVKQDILLPICSALLFYVLFYMINPSYRPAILQNQTGDLVLAGTVYSVLLSWLILHFLDSFHTASTVYSALRVFLVFCMAEFAVAVITSLSECVSSIRRIQATNTMPGLNLVPTYCFAVLSSCVTAAEYILNILLLYLARKLLHHLQEAPYTEACCNAALHLSRWCKKYLVMLVLSAVTLNLLQLLFATHLHDLSIGLRLPLVSIALAFALLALTHLLYRGKELQEDNDLFI